MKEMSKEYASAIFALGRETGKEELIEISLQKVLAVMQAEPEYQDFLSCPGIPLDARLSGIREAFSSIACEEVVSLVELLCRRGRMGMFEACCLEYQALLRAFRQSIVAKVISAVPLTKEEETRLQAQLEKRCGQSVILSCSVNPDMIGGMIVEMDGGIIDGSLKNRLKQVKEVVSQ